MPSSQHGRTATGPGFTRGNICRRSQPPIEDEEVFVKVNVNVKARERAEAGKGEIFAWCWYDFANSAFVTVVITVVGGVFFTQSVCAGAEWAEFLWGTALSASAAVAMLAGPMLGRWADRKASKKPLLIWLTLVCVGTTALLGLPRWGVAVLTGLVVAANAAFLLGENLVAAFLPELAPPGKRGRISAYGWGFGYVGGLASLGLALWILSAGGDGAARKVFPATAAFMLLAALPTILFLRERAQPGQLSVTEPDGKVIWNTLRARPDLRGLLSGLGLSLTGLSAVVGFASIYATKEIGFTLEDTVKLFVVLQLAAVVGALATGPWQDRSGARPVLLGALGLWGLVSVGAWLSRSAESFYAVAALAGLGMGWLQSAGRAAVAEITPEGQQGEVFGLWGFAGKLAGIVGPVVFGWLASMVGLREAVILNGVWFILGAWILWGVDKR
ncbi:MFS transporter [bacterium]|nr:MFS transporter [bacterium]